MWKSLKDYSVAVVRWWWVVVMGAIVAVVGIVLDIWQDLALPVWLWVSLGFVGLVVAQFLAFHEQRMRSAHLEAGLPNIELGEPRLDPNETLIRTHMVTPPSSSSTVSPPQQRVLLEQLRIALFRIPVLNRDGHAPDVSVRLTKTEPPIAKGLPAALLHVAGDNPDDHVTFIRSFPLRKDEPAYVDVVSFSNSRRPRFFLHKIASADAAEEVQLDTQSYTFTIGVFAEKVSKQQDYRVDRDSSGRLTMTRLSP